MRSHLSLEQLNTLLALVECGSFSAAGNRMGLAQSTVSQHLKRLEQALDMPLIIRGQRGCRPTPAAQSLLTYVKSMLRLEDRILQTVRGRAPRLGASSNIGVYLLPAILRAFQDKGGQTPNLVIGSNPEIVARLESAEVDAALLEWWDEREGFHWKQWRTEPCVVIVAPDHPLARTKSISRAELSGMALIGGEEGTGTGHLLRRSFGDNRLPSVSMRLGSTEAVKRAVEAGLGMSLVLACAVEKEVAEGRLCAISLDDQPLAKSLCLVWRNDTPNDCPMLSHLVAAATPPISS